MIYTVTLNPALDYIVSIDNYELGKTNRTTDELLLSGGKGINISILLNNLGYKSTALGFVAGFTGNKIISDVTNLGIKSNFIKINSGYTRINVKLKDFDGTEINGMGPKIDDKSFNKLIKQFSVMNKDDIVFLSGSIPKNLPQNIYAQLMKISKANFIVDTTKEQLMHVLEYKPFFIKPNNYELGVIFNTKIETHDQAIKYAKKLKKMGAQNVMVSMSSKGAVLVDENNNIHSSLAPKIKLVNAVGAGDSMVAGFIAGWLESHDYETAFKMGLASGSASAACDGFATKKQILNLL